MLKTNLGLSDEEFSHGRLHPEYGTGQAAQTAVIWDLISNRLYYAHTALSYDAVLMAPTISKSSRSSLFTTPLHASTTSQD
jgi:hypothetical protein